MHWKKVIAVCLPFVLVLLSSGCSKSGNTFDSNEASEKSENITNEAETLLPDNTPNPILEVEVEPSRIDVAAIPEFVKIIVTNTSQEFEYKGSYHYSIEYFDDVNWVQVVSPAVHDESVVIKPASEVEFDYIQLQPTEYDYSAGIYRVNYNNYGYGKFSIVD